MHFLKHFTANTRQFQAKKIFSKKLVTLSEESQFIWLNTKIPLKTENFSKIVQGALFGTSFSQYQIFQSKTTFLEETGHHFSRRAVYLSHFGR